MSERPQLAVVLSVLAHAALVAGAAMMPPSVAEGAGAQDARAIDGKDGGFYGNTFDIEGFVDGKLGDGAKESAPATEDSKPAPKQVQQEAEPAPSPKPKPKPKRKKKRKRRKRTSGEHTEGGNKSASDKNGKGDKGDGGTKGDGDGGRQHGSEQAEKGKLSAAAAFTHGLALSYSTNPVWHKLPVGEVGTAIVSLRVSSGRVHKTDIENGAPKILVKIASGAAAMTRIRLLDDIGVTRLKLKVSIVQGDAPETDEVDGKKVLEAKDVSPTRKKPGSVLFAYGSGRQVHIEITLLKSGS